ncbi:unnamed protein product [Albugo candida]|uniref:Prokaryotic-type class I peptide chain release factors domain-containing protein n=1 Tax=Albugo candida TaxID=65357 RepID=A0A024GNY2_9STRA|nr:unnamed protein product [Albugo candida]|eukprot:CCI48486.1 unnamed protein product [Albugo candida]
MLRICHFISATCLKKSLTPRPRVDKLFQTRNFVTAFREEDVTEQFVKGSGKGGQKINKVRNCVLLKHSPTGIHVRCQKTRCLDDNRRIARKLLTEKLDDLYNGEKSVRNQKIQKIQKRKANRRVKAAQKYGNSGKAGHDTSEEAIKDADRAE